MKQKKDTVRLTLAFSKTQTFTLSHKYKSIHVLNSTQGLLIPVRVMRSWPCYLILVTVSLGAWIYLQYSIQLFL